MKSSSPSRHVERDENPIVREAGAPPSLPPLPPSLCLLLLVAKSRHTNKRRRERAQHVAPLRAPTCDATQSSCGSMPKTSKDSGKPVVKFVYTLIPADTEEPYEEAQLPIPVTLEENIGCLAKVLNAYYTRTAPFEASGEAGKARAIEGMKVHLDKTQPGADPSNKMLGMLAGTQTIDIVRTTPRGPRGPRRALTPRPPLSRAGAAAARDQGHRLGRRKPVRGRQGRG